MFVCFSSAVLFLFTISPYLAVHAIVCSLSALKATVDRAEFKWYSCELIEVQNCQTISGTLSWSTTFEHFDFVEPIEPIDSIAWNCFAFLDTQSIWKEKAKQETRLARRQVTTKWLTVNLYHCAGSFKLVDPLISYEAKNNNKRLRSRFIAPIFRNHLRSFTGTFVMVGFLPGSTNLALEQLSNMRQTKVNGSETS